MSMTKHDYDLIAMVLRGRINNAKAGHLFGYSDSEVKHSVDTLLDFADFLASELEHNNKNFDRVVFLAKAGIEL